MTVQRGRLKPGRDRALGYREQPTTPPFCRPVCEIIARSRKRGADELTLEKDVSSLATPMAIVQMRRLIHLHPSQERKK